MIILEVTNLYLCLEEEEKEEEDRKIPTLHNIDLADVDMHIRVVNCAVLKLAVLLIKGNKRSDENININKKKKRRRREEEA